MRSIVAILASSAFFAGCAVEQVDVDKDDIVSGRADAADYCGLLHLEPGCDACRELGWYHDGECDDFCAEPDPDCSTPSPSGPPTLSELDYECVAVRSEIFFDLTIVDVGDEQGTVYVNDGDAPRNYDAHYDRLTSDGPEGHTFVFGFDEYNDGTHTRLNNITITRVSHAFFQGTVEYGENPYGGWGGVMDDIVCYDMDALESGETAHDFECLSPEQGILFDLDIVDVGDEEGLVTVNDGGAPVSYDAEWNELEEIGGNAQHRFVFGFDELNDGEIDELFAVNIGEISINFARGRADYLEGSDIICHIAP